MNYQILIKHLLWLLFVKMKKNIKLVKDLVKQVEEIKNSKTKIDNQEITESI